MPTLKEIKGRIGSVKSTLKITSAMKLVSSAKLRKAQNAIAAMRPYEEELRRMLEMASGAGGVTETVTSPAKTANFAGDVPENVTSPAVIIAVASNSSLCGGFNANVIAKVRSVRRPGDVVYSIGRKMADAMARDGFSSPSDYSALSEHPAYADAAALVEKLAGDFYEGRISGVTLVYTHFVSTAKQVPVVEPLLHAAGRDGISSASLRDPIRANTPERVCLPTFNKVLDKHNHEVNAVIGGLAPSLYEMPDRLIAAMLCNILGGPASNSLLNAELRERRGWVYGIECNYTQYADTGVVAISFGCDKPNLEGCMKAIDKILAGLREKPLSDSRLKAYRKQLLGQLAISSEAGEAQCLSLGKSMLAWGEVMTSAKTRSIIEAITAEQLQAMARRLFDPSNLSSLIYL